MPGVFSTLRPVPDDFIALAPKTYLKNAAKFWRASGNTIFRWELETGVLCQRKVYARVKTKGKSALLAGMRDGYIGTEFPVSVESYRIVWGPWTKAQARGIAHA